MPRRSVGDLAGEIYRARSVTPPPPPAHLGREGARLWRDIVADRAPGWFGAGGLVLLESFCAAHVAARAAARRMMAAEPGTPDSRRATSAFVKLAALSCTLAAKLRVCPSAVKRADGARADECGLSADGDPLLGGAAVGPARKPRVN